MSQTTSQIITEYSPYKLLPHPLNLKVYGHEARDPELEKSIGQYGIITPVEVVRTTHGGVEGLYVLSGHRRVEVAKELKILVPVHVLEKDYGDEWQETHLLEANRQRVKTPEQRTREYQEHERIEKILAEVRRAEGVRETTTASERAATAVGATSIVGAKDVSHCYRSRSRKSGRHRRACSNQRTKSGTGIHIPHSVPP